MEEKENKHLPMTKEMRNELELKWSNAGISDDFIFGKVVASEEIYPNLIKSITNDTIGKKSRASIQRSLKNSRFSKASRFDVWLETEKKLYDVEMQNTISKWLPQRLRFYESIATGEIISEGDHYSTLKSVIIIFVVKEDPFKQGLPIYTFENTCKESNGLKLNDGCVKIILNASAYTKLKQGILRTFLKNVMGEEDETMFGKKLKDKVEEVKNNKELRSEYMSIYAREMDSMYEAKMEGKLEGMLEALLLVGKSKEEIINLLNITEEEFDKVVK